MPSSARLYHLLRQAAHGGFTCVTRTDCTRGSAEPINGHWLPPSSGGDDDDDEDSRDVRAAAKVLVAGGHAAAAEEEEDARRAVDAHAAELERAAGAEAGSFRARKPSDRKDGRCYVASLDATQLYASSLGEFFFLLLPLRRLRGFLFWVSLKKRKNKIFLSLKDKKNFF